MHGFEGLRPAAWLAGDSLLHAAATSPERVALVADDESFTYGRLLDTALRLARGLQECGLEPGDRVAIHMANSWPCVATLYATTLAGGIFVVVNPQVKADKLRAVLVDSGARFLVTDAPAEAPADLRDLRVVAPGAAPASLDWLVLSRDPEPEPRPVGTIPMDVATLVYTSGSTGVPKGVMLTHGNLVFVAESVSRYLRLGPDDRIFNVFPLAFTYGLNQLLVAARLGATLVLERSFAFPLQVLERLERQEVTVFPGVPTMFATLLGLREQPRLERVRCVTNAGAGMPPDFLEGIVRIFPSASVFLMYGQTECTRISYLEPELMLERPRSVGRAIPGTAAFVLGADGAPAPPGETGVLHVRGPHVMAGYWEKPALSAEAVVPGEHPGERVLRTGDLFRTDDEGYLYFVSRTDDVIKTRGEKVSPLEVEHALYEVAGVREVAVVGVPDAVLGQAVRAFVALDPGAEVSEAGLKRHCRARLENHMVPREVIFLPELPKTESGKILRRSLVAGAGEP